MLNKLTEPVISLFLLPNQLEINDAQVYDTQLIFSHAARFMGGFLKLKNLYWGILIVKEKNKKDCITLQY